MPSLLRPYTKYCLLALLLILFHCAGDDIDFSEQPWRKTNVPYVDPDGCNQEFGLPVHIRNIESGVTVIYTTNGKRPSRLEGTVYTDSFFLDPGHENLYVRAIAYRDGYPDYELTNREPFTVHGWKVLRRIQFTNDCVQAYDFTIHNGYQYVAYADYFNNYRVTVKRCSISGTNWTTVTDAMQVSGLSAVNMIRIRVTGSRIFLALKDQDNEIMKIIQSDSLVNPGWSDLSGMFTIGHIGTKFSDNRFQFQVNGITPYLLFNTNNAATPQMTLIEYDTPTGTVYPTNVIAEQTGIFLAMDVAFSNGIAIPFIAFSDEDNNNQVKVMMYGSSGWISNTPPYTTEDQLAVHLYMDHSTDPSSPYFACGSQKVRKREDLGDCFDPLRRTF